ncbi:uncharacterized protein PG998_002341 [Apiospora kogelbergensis]|uniref:Uncharacterized protein n=1 Tax=Apiospora kogelbergensis TaxID=1337665 RepID=A0AAW0QG74_9PEZI
MANTSFSGDRRAVSQFAHGCIMLANGGRVLGQCPSQLPVHGRVHIANPPKLSLTAGVFRQQYLRLAPVAFVGGWSGHSSHIG